MPFCKKCGVYLEENYISCPDCGEVVTKKQPQIIKEDENIESGPWKGFAIASLPSSIVGLVFTFTMNLTIFGLIISNIALVLAILGLKSRKKHRLALAGMIISCITITIAFMLIVTCIACINIAFRNGC